MLKAAIEDLERFLRIDRRMKPWDVMRARGVYLYALLTCSLQVLNLFGMTRTYGGWVIDHWAAVIAISVHLATMLLLRWTKNFILFVAIYSGVSLVALWMSSLSAGIHTSLLPAIVLGPMMAAFVCGWRTATVIGIGAIAFVTYQYTNSLSLLGAEAGWTVERTEQRYFQAVFSIIMGTAMSAALSATCHNAFMRAERARVRAEKSARAKNDFLAVMSHELRTPMNGVLGLTEAVLSEGPGPVNDRQRTLLGSVRGSGEHLLALLNDLLDLSKIEAGKIKLDPRPFHLPTLLDAVKETYAETAVAKGIALELEVSDAVPEWVLGDDQRVRQVLNNLVSNGVKFTEEGGVRLVAEDGEDDAIVFTVTDTGKGIPEATRSIIFEPFEQGDRGTTRRFGGTGLGLSICRQLCVLMGGSIELVRSEPGETVFMVTLPLPHAAKPEADRTGSGLLAGGLEGLRVLVAEDNAVNRLVLGEFLTAWHAKPVFAVDGVEALELLDTADFDVVLVDRQMPRLDGEGVVEQIRARKDEKALVPIIAVTADAMEADRFAMLAKGADGFVSKPLKPETLKREIALVYYDEQARERGRGELLG
ncbi:ATP-binding protein [Parvularcula lutaonensis]|uniref:histidine kinase n=1 Tax=Parvularcula lutaonensis TaxID=491923 RepID=A0ABV7M7P8_9PROT|nr:ATP-binding protein [Parvularcula lutaonensis]GGY42636.1 hypothetical protein GCM10007148_09110 [Parvularcula lutaonensis]